MAAAFMEEAQSAVVQASMVEADSTAVAVDTVADTGNRSRMSEMKNGWPPVAASRFF